MMLVRLLVIMALASTYCPSAKGSVPECARLLTEEELPPLLTTHRSLQLPEIFSIMVPDNSSIVAKFASAHESLANTAYAYLKEELGVRSVIVRKDGRADYIEIIPPRYPDGSLIPLKELKGAHWLTKLAAKAAEKGIEHSVGFSTTDFFEGGAMGHYNYRFKRVALSWASISAKSKMSDVEVHEWGHMQRSLATARAWKNSDLPADQVTIDAGMKFYLSKPDHTKALYEVVDGSPGQDVIAMRELGPGTKGKKIRLVPREVFFESSEPFAPLQIYLEAPYFTSLERYKYNEGYFIEESAVHLEAQVKMGVTNLERLVVAMNKSANPTSQFSIVNIARSEFSNTNYRHELASEMITESITTLRILAAALQKDGIKIEEISYGSNSSERVLENRKITLEGGVLGIFSSHAINWHRSRGTDWSKDPKVVAEALSRTIESLRREQELVAAYRRRLDAIEAELNSFESAFAENRETEAWLEAKTPAESLVITGRRALFKVKDGNSNELSFDDLLAVIKHEIPFSLTVAERGGNVTYPKARLKSMVLRGSRPRLVATSEGRVLRASARMSTINFEGPKLNGIPKKLVEARAERKRAALLVRSTKRVLKATDLEQMKDSSTPIRIVYRETHKEKNHVKGTIEEIVYSEGADNAGYLVFEKAEGGGKEKIEFGRLVIIEEP